MPLKNDEKHLLMHFHPDIDNHIINTLDIGKISDIFDRPTDTFDPVTAHIAAALSMSFADDGLLYRNLKELGFDDIVPYSPDNTDPEHIGIVIACREHNSCHSVAVVLRGTQGAEWYSNFDIGAGGEHRGFSLAADYAERTLDDHLMSRHIDKAQFLITGYSRGGAVADILGKRLCDRFGFDSVRGYNFASPNTVRTDSSGRYRSVFNIVREEDFFTRVPLSVWGYGRYGATHVIRAGISDEFHRLTGKDHIGFESAHEVNEALVEALKLAPDARAYYERRYPVGDEELSMYGFMLCIASTLAHEADDRCCAIMAEAAFSDFAGLMMFFSSGMDIADMMSPIQGTPVCSVSDSHSPAAYICAMGASLFADTV